MMGVHPQSYDFPVKSIPSPFHVTQEAGTVCLHPRVGET